MDDCVFSCFLHLHPDLHKLIAFADLQALFVAMYIKLTQVLLFLLRLLAQAAQPGDSPTSNLRNRTIRVTQFLGVSYLY